MAFGIDDAIAAGLKIVDKFIPDPAAKIKAEEALRADLMEWDKGQMEVNKAEASSGSLFIGGWRPFIGWTCGLALAFQYLITPIAMWLAGIFEVTIPAPPPLDDMLWQLMAGLLGMGGLRTFEKIKGVAKK